MSDDRNQEMDAITAHLDRGWDLLQRGDLLAARVSAHQILQLDAESPEAHTLLGSIAAAEGDLDEAQELLGQAMDLDPDYLEPVLYACEVAMLRGELDRALELCELGQALASDPEETIDITLLRIEALIAAGRVEEASQASARLPAAEAGVAPAVLVRAGRAWLDLGQPDRAEPLLRAALERPEAEADARYFLGLALESRGEVEEALQHFLRARELDLAQPDPNWAFSAEDFQALIRQTIARLPAALRGLLEGAPLRVLDHPAPELIAQGLDPRSMAYLAAAPVWAPLAKEKTARARTKGKAKDKPKGKAKAQAKSRGAEGPIGCLFIYKRPLERFARSGAAVPEELRAVLEEEARSFLGLPDGPRDDGEE